METQSENDAIAKYLTALKNASNDNERFAALLMVAKVSKESSCDVEIKRRILDAVGGKFFTRLLKTKNVPEECPATVYKSVAMSVLSALCKDPDMACSPTLIENIISFNSILLLDPAETDQEGRQLVDDTFECVNSLCQTQEGLQSLRRTSTVSALCEVIASQSYGWEKAQDVLLCLVSRYGGSLFADCEMGYHSVISAISRQFHEDQSLKKFELCKTLVFLLTAFPNMSKEGEPPWIGNIVGGLDSILRSKVGKHQREPALRLASMLADTCGVYCLLPPETADNKLFLLTTHLCCVEVRMVLEDSDMKQFQTLENGRLLSSCYSFLESVINYMTGGPTLSLDERQIMQLHSAMVGAFSAVAHFLKKVSDDPTVQWDSTILATVRVLAAWLSEETSALKEEVYELIPFLIQISKMCIPPEQISQVNEKQSSVEKTNNTTKDLSADINDADEAIDKMETMEIDDPVSNTLSGDPVEQVMDSDISEHVQKNIAKMEKTKSENCDKAVDEMVVETVDQRDENTAETHLETKQQRTDSEKHVTFDAEQTIDSDMADLSVNPDQNKPIQTSNQKQPMDLYTLESMAADKEVLSERELSELHLRVDIFHFLLPAVCHFTADDEPRQMLLNCGAPSLLDLYMWKQWEKFITTPTSRDTQSSLLILCNIFLNFTIVDPSCITKNPEFAHILLLAVKGVHAMELNEEHIGIWSHLVTLGLMLLRQLHQTAHEFLERESLVQFYSSCIKFLNGAYKVKARKKGNGMLELADQYKTSWEQISQTWFLSMQALSACIPLVDDIPATILKSGWLPAALKTLLEVKSSSVAEEVRSCYMLLFTTVAQKDESAKSVIKEKGGIEFARSYKSKELSEILQN